MQESSVKFFDPHRVRPLPDQPRKRFRGIAELAESIREIGQSTPGLVTLVEDDENFHAQLVDGERRLRACKLAGVAFRAEVKIPAQTPATRRELYAASFAANFGKQDHDAIEIAQGLAELTRLNYTTQQLAAISGKSLGWVLQHLNLLKLHPVLQALMVPEGEEREGAKLSFPIAQLLCPLPYAEQLRLAGKISDLSLVGARRLILKKRSKGAVRENISHARRAASLKSVIADSADRVGIYLDMPGRDLNALIDALQAFGQREAILAIDELVDNLGGLRDAIAARVPAHARAGMTPAPAAKVSGGKFGKVGL